MKKRNLIIIVLLLIGLNVSSQIKDTLNFTTIDKDIVWQKIFENKSENLLIYFKKTIISNIKTDNLQEIDNRLSFEIQGDNVDTKKYGGTWGNTLIPLKFPLSYLVLIDFKENKYRVTVKSIIADYGMQLGHVKFSDVLLRNGEISNKKIIIGGLNFLDKHLTEKFTIIDKNDDW